MRPPDWSANGPGSFANTAGCPPPTSASSSRPNTSSHGSTDALGNLAFTCLHCNKHKGPNLSGLDRAGPRPKLVRLFHPRVHRWPFHFRWDGPRVVGRTPIGRVTVEVLAMNDPLMVLLREELIAEGVFDVR